ncbi:flagellin [Halanaerobium sp. DL-01]|uniref:flagellin N-terminal helical domain-containing protein n=1 Tax=Halanaerobium sp. DL-01 TaxID=1653064 RepID=UPI000DF3D2ED|nr:flagellin [Halanaerobium sp. DL-01]RCW81664.1 flagellin [Halanaerobium sp. DL-01]
MRINTNIAALNSYNQLNNTQNNLEKSLQRLSSGKRINGAADDAAGLAISEKMKSQTTGLAQAQRNAQDGISMIQTAEGALKESHSILQRMRELAVQSANDTNTEADRNEIQKEVDQLAAELTRIGETTEFNTQKLLDGSLDDTKFQIGANKGQNMEIAINDMKADALGVAGEGGASFEISTTVANTDIAAGDLANLGLEDGEQTLEVSKVDNVTLADGAVANYGLKNSDGEVIATSTDGNNYQLLDGAYEEGNLSQASYNGTNVEIAFADEVTSGEVTLTGVDDAAGTIGGATAEATVDAKGLETGTYSVAVEVDQASFEAAEYFSDVTWTGAGTATSAASDIESVLLDENGKATAVEFGGTIAASGSYYNIEDINLEADATTPSNVVPADAEAAFTANTAFVDGDTLEIRGEGGIDVSSQTAADNAISKLDDAIANVSAERSKLGAIQNRLDHTINNLNTAEENLTAAESRISDVDMAKEMMSFTKNQILSQAGTAMLAQANQLPQGVLQLLG